MFGLGGASPLAVEVRRDMLAVVSYDTWPVLHALCAEESQSEPRVVVAFVAFFVDVVWHFHRDIRVS